MPDWKALLDNEFDLFEPISLAQRLVRIPSVSRTDGEVEIARFIANYFIDNGIPVEWQEIDGRRANLIAEVQGALGEGPVLLFNGHMDTVPVGSGWTYPPLGGEIVNNRLYGRGACDMKGALAAMMYAAKMVALFAHSLYGKLKLVFVVDEEEENAGIREWMRAYRARKEIVDYAIVGEPTGLNISLGHRGVAAYRIEVRGKSCHAAVAERGLNAVHYASLIVDRLERKRKDLLSFEDPDLGAPALSVGKISGGVSPNVVPETCTLEVDVRTLPSFSLGEMERLLQETVEEIRAKEGVSFEYTITQCIPHLPPAKVPRDTELVGFLSRSISDIPGEVPIFSPFPASCEASFLVEAGIPTLIFGPGRIEEAHSANEFVPVTQVVTASRVYALLTLRLLGGE